jgi:hypothetical protein
MTLENPFAVAQDLRVNPAVMDAFTEYEKFVGRVIQGDYQPAELARHLKLHRLELIAVIVLESRAREATTDGT